MSRRNNNILNKKLLFDNESPIFKFLLPDGNDNLSKMSGSDLQELIILLDEYYIQLRDYLGFKEYVTFGVELEFEKAKKIEIERQLFEIFPNRKWEIKSDSSLVRGAEINSPILKDTITNWENLKKVCSIIEPLALIGKNSGGHIHVGTQTLGDKKESWLNFIKMWSVYENIIFRFVYGEFLTARPDILEYAKPIGKHFLNDYKIIVSNKVSLEALINEISHGRYYAINFDNVLRSHCNRMQRDNTIEFRCPNGSLDPVIWQNNVNLFVKMLDYCRSSRFNDDIVEQRHKLNLNKYASLIYYDEIYLEQALELCDMLFTNNLDKICFLKQYLKSFQVCKKCMDYTKSKAYILTKNN